MAPIRLRVDVEEIVARHDHRRVGAEGAVRRVVVDAGDHRREEVPAVRVGHDVERAEAALPHGGDDVVPLQKVGDDVCVGGERVADGWVAVAGDPAEGMKDDLAVCVGRRVNAQRGLEMSSVRACRGADQRNDPLPQRRGGRVELRRDGKGKAEQDQGQDRETCFHRSLR